MSSLEYLEEERKKLWAKILILEESLDKKTSDHEKEAKQSSKKASEYRNRAGEAKEKADRYSEEAGKLVDDLKSTGDSLRKINSAINKYHDNILEKNNLVEAIYKNVSERREQFQEQIAGIEDILESHEELVEKIGKLESIRTQSDDHFNKIAALHKAALGRRNEIGELYYEIYGYEEDGKDGEEPVQVEGLKEKLEEAYSAIERNLKELGEGITKLRTDTKDRFEELLLNSDAKLTSNFADWLLAYESIVEKIESLLPNALTVGLSYAYAEKRKEEVAESRILSARFKWAIAGLVLVSLIPFGVSITLLVQGKGIEEVILDMPRLVVSILPLYIPVFWLAHSTNKKLSLSKRLIEEYTHKEVLSKTFEGLSTQINSIQNEPMSGELKNKLLFNILEVSSENPGKLISDYNKSDHPLMDALEKSVKLANAVNKLQKIPGLSKLTKVLDKKAADILVKESVKIDDVLEQISNEDSGNGSATTHS